MCGISIETLLPLLLMQLAYVPDSCIPDLLLCSVSTPCTMLGLRKLRQNSDMLQILHLMYDNSAPNWLHHFETGENRAVPTGFPKLGSGNRAQGALVEIDVSAPIFG